MYGLGYNSSEMPIYEYLCRQCDEKFEKFTHRRDDPEPVTCPHCGENHTERVFSTFATTGASQYGCAPTGRFT